MALVVVSTEDGDVVLSLQVGDQDLDDSDGILLTSETDAEIAHAIAAALNASENASYDL